MGVGNYLPVETAEHHRRLQSSETWLWESLVSHYLFVYVTSLEGTAHTHRVKGQVESGLTWKQRASLCSNFRMRFSVFRVGNAGSFFVVVMVTSDPPNKGGGRGRYPA